MASQPSAGGSPPKPWEQAGSASGPSPFKPPTNGSTADAVESSGTARPGEIVTSANRTTTAANTNALSRPVPTRPWEQQNYGSTYGGYGSNLGVNSGYGSNLGMNSGYGSNLGMNSGYGSGMYGSSYSGYGGYGSSYGSGMYGSGMYRGGYGGLSGGGMYGGGMYNSGVGGMGGYGMGMGPYGGQDPNDPFGEPPSPPGFWISFLRVMQGVVNFFGRLSMLIDQNTQAFHMFMSALLQLFDRGGLLYGELARFVLRILGIKTKPRKMHPQGPDGHLLPHQPHGPHGNQNYLEGPKAAAPPSGGGWDNVWGDKGSN